MYKPHCAMNNLALLVAVLIILCVVMLYHRTEGWAPGQAYSGPSSSGGSGGGSSPSAPSGGGGSAPSAPSAPSPPSVPYNAGMGDGHQGRNYSSGAYGGGWYNNRWRSPYIQPWGVPPYAPYAPAYAYTQPYYAPQVYTIPYSPWYQRWWPWGTPNLPDCEDVNYAVPCYDGRA
jgi:hypothetical protein